MKKRYTIVVMPSTEGNVRQYSISRRTLNFLYLLLFLFIAVAVGGNLVLGWLSYDKFNETEKLNDRIATLEKENASKDERFKSLREEMQTIQKMADTVSEVLGINREHGILGQGGDGFGTEALEGKELDDPVSETVPIIKPELRVETVDIPLVDQMTMLRNLVEPIYEYAVEHVEVIDQTPAILPILVSADSKTDTFWFSSGFGKRIHPTTRKREFHRGLDIATRKDTPVIATADGIITRFTTDEFLGNVIDVEHKAAKLKTVYGHLKRFSEGMKEGKEVKRGEIIGFVGESGRSTGAHLHYGVYLTDKESWVDPKTYIIAAWSH